MLSGDGSGFEGSFAVSGGTLAGTTDSLQGDILNDATLEFDQDFDGAFDGYISGTGQVVKTGSGALELLSGNDYTGGTVMSAGSLVAGQDFALGNGALTMNGGHLFIWSEQEVTSLSGSGGELEVDFLLSINQDIDTSFSGGLSGDGGFLGLTATGTAVWVKVGEALVVMAPYSARWPARTSRATPIPYPKPWGGLEGPTRGIGPRIAHHGDAFRRLPTTRARP